MPRPLARPRTKVVLPAPTSPMSSITKGNLIVPEFIASAKFSPKVSISCSEWIIMVLLYHESIYIGNIGDGDGSVGINGTWSGG